MTPKQIQLVKQSFEAAAMRSDRLADLFFVGLGTSDAACWRRFRGLGVPDHELIEGLAAIVGSLDRLHPIVPVLEWLAFRGVRHGLGAPQYQAIGEALVAALANALRDAFTTEHRQAWTDARQAVADIMVRALSAEPLAA
jgi:hypothetical protein